MAPAVRLVERLRLTGRYVYIQHIYFGAAHERRIIRWELDDCFEGGL